MSQAASFHQCEFKRFKSVGADFKGGYHDKRSGVLYLKECLKYI